MAKDPAFLFYSSDFLTGTTLMNDEQVGKYIRLLCLQHQKGRLSEKDMLKICLTYDKDIFEKFAQDADGNFFNQRLEIEATKRKAYSDSRRANREKKQTDMSNICDSYVPHMENENENENINVIGIKEEVQEKPKTPTQKEIRDLVFAEPIFLSRLNDAHPGKDYEKAFGECYAYWMNRPNPPNVLWLWRQKLMTWLSNMKHDTPLKQPKKKITLKDLET